MEIVNNYQLNEICLQCIDRMHQVKFDYLYYFELLYQTGARAREPLMPELWSYENELTISLQPLKNNGLRIFNTELLPPNFVDMVQEGSFLLTKGNYSMLRSYFLQAMPLNLYLDEERTLLHTFRYNRVRQMYESGQTIQDIKYAFGWHSYSMVEKYLWRPIHSKTSLLNYSDPNNIPG